jgi:hypothetical protein
MNFACATQLERSFFRAVGIRSDLKAKVENKDGFE